MKHFDVAIGILFRDRKVLICKRRPDAHLAGYWEFPGGKCQPGETPGDCLIRELREEVGVVVCPIHAFTPIAHTYVTRSVRLHPFLCQVTAGEPKGLAAEAIEWIAPKDLPRYSFPPANAALIEELLAYLAAAPATPAAREERTH